MAEDGTPVVEAKALLARVVVAIPTLNEEKAIRLCIASLMEQGSKPGAALIVVADGGSSDRTRAVVTELAREHPNLRLIDNPGKLQATAINCVAELAETKSRDILVRCDAHSIYPSGYIAEVAASLVATGADSVVVPMDSYGETCFARGAACAVDTPFGSGGAAHRGGRRSGFVDHGHHAGFQLAAFRRLGGYDPLFATNEDAEFDRRLTQTGGRIWLDASIRVKYQMRATPKGLARQYYRYGAGRARTVLKHRMRPKLRQFVPVLVLCGLGLAVLGALTLAPVLWLVPASYLVALATISVWLWHRHGTACALAAGLALAIMHNAWAGGFLRQILKGNRP